MDVDISRISRECLLSGIVVALLATVILAALMVFLVGLESEPLVLVGVAVGSTVCGCGIALAWCYFECVSSYEDERNGGRR